MMRNPSDLPKKSGVTGSLEVRVAGEYLEGWKSASVGVAIDRLAGSFSLSMAETSPEDPLERKLLVGQFVEIRLAGELVLSGHIRKQSKTYDGTSNSINISGSDASQDLVDCSATNEPGAWKGGRVETIARDLIAPFPRLRYRSDLQSDRAAGHDDVELNTGETVFSALDGMARSRGLLLASDGAGGIFLTEPGRDRAPVVLKRGANIERGTLVEDDSGRFSSYIGHSQHGGTSYRAEAADPGVSRFRPFVIVAERKLLEPDLRQRVRFEASVRAARAHQWTYTLPGWRLDGHFWRVGELVPVFDPVLEIGTAGGAPVDLVVGSIEWSQSAAAGSTTTLGLHLPGAFAREPIPKPEDPIRPGWKK